MPRSVSVEVGGVCGSCAAMLGIQGCHQRNHVIILAGGRCGFDRFVAGSVICNCTVEVSYEDG